MSDNDTNYAARIPPYRATRPPPLLDAGRKRRSTKSIFKLGVWNVRSISQPGKPELLCEELNRFGIRLSVITEAWLCGCGEFEVETPTSNIPYVIYHSGGMFKERGVAFVALHSDIELLTFTAVNDRIAVMEIATQ